MSSNPYWLIREYKEQKAIRGLDNAGTTVTRTETVDEHPSEAAAVLAASKRVVGTTDVYKVCRVVRIVSNEVSVREPKE